MCKPQTYGVRQTAARRHRNRVYVRPPSGFRRASCSQRLCIDDNLTILFNCFLDDVPRSVENGKRSLRQLQYQLMLLRQVFVCSSCLIPLHSECQALTGASEVVCKPSACESLSWLPASPPPSSARPWTPSASASHCGSPGAPFPSCFR